jgi:hypothetical protein
MTSSDPTQKIQDLLRHDYLRERRKGIEEAAKLLAQGLHREPLRKMLSQVAKGDLANNLAQLAQEVLDEDDQRHAQYPRQYTSGAEHIEEATCPNCHHLNYYDKRQICPGEERYRTRDDKGVLLDKVLVKCQKCGAQMTIMVNCEGYK